MTEEINTKQKAQDETSTVPCGQRADTGSARNGEESTRPRFNRHLYENLLCHIEGQIECWNRKAVREPSPEAAHALWLKAEGLGYALRLLYAFEPEFRELTDSASHCTANGSA